MQAELKEHADEKSDGTTKDTIYNSHGPSNHEEESSNVLPEEPEFYEVETTLDTGATTHAADRVDFPGHDAE